MNDKLSDAALQVLHKRYFSRDKDGKVVEDWEGLSKRVAKHLSTNDKEWEEDFFEVLFNRRFIPNSPCLMNAGHSLNSLSACFLITIDDSMDSIGDAIKDVMTISKYGGGVGMPLSKLRGKGSLVSSTNRESSGPIQLVLRPINVAAEAVKQGGVRRAALMGTMHINHPDIEDFITCKKTEGDINNFNLSVALTNDFMEAYKKKRKIALVDPHTKKVVKKIDAVELMDKIADYAWLNGEPGIIFIDRINEENPINYLGEIESVNACSEQPLLPYGSCVLGSIALSRYWNNGEFDWDLFKKDIHTAVRMLDNTIDIGDFPLDKLAETARNNRNIGLGVMGFADLLSLMGIEYGSEKSYKIAEKVAKALSKEAFNASCDLAKEKGAFPNFDFKKYKHKIGSVPEYGIRNACQTSIAPTGSIAMIADVSYSIEPHFNICYTKNVMEGDKIYIVNPYFIDIAKNEGFWTPDLLDKISKDGVNIPEIPEEYQKAFITSYSLTAEQHLKMQSIWQKYTDSAVSKTINLPNEATIEDVKEAYLMADKLGLKGLTIYRDGSRLEQVVEAKKQERRGVYRYKRRPKKSEATIQKFKIPFPDGKSHSVYVTLSENGDNEPIDCFISCKKMDIPMGEEMLKAIGILTSLTFKAGVPMEDIIKALKGVTGYGFFVDGHKYKSIIDLIGRTIDEKYGNKNGVKSVIIEKGCPDC